ncbi:ras GTPase-activating protein-binding protein 2 [Anopheles funestus]|uniref:ras GTPase-activating protein-binding protein 2 n=1 Tax=Anopheles funestus TaxID=62324 RepID=UPI0020C7145D|nr:ras GTPase-activating protein-binding protein 2 [Anopheles funestus]XP_049300458.1 ras GTPase-activating protein-binding protein 2 [Anopheles funestus]
MVMDAQPSPQNVGREFVRQYYTLLNKAPDFLHRFYNSSSSFVHGGLDAKSQDTTLVIGQKQIQNKIQQLNFRDCHAKISQVDSQATLGNGVVVQVTGELSNDGQPMRRFTQTFVLAAQSPKKYYVHNDIFRYQDVYSDDELDEACDRANGGTDEDGLHPLGTDGTDPAALVVGETPMGIGPGTAANATSGLVGVGVHGHPVQPGQPPVLGSQNAPQALYYPSNVISSSGTGLLPGVTAYGAPPTGAQSQPASQQQPTHQPPQQQAPQQQQQQLNGRHESLLKNVGTPEGSTAAAVAAVLLSSSTDPQGLKSKIDQTPMGVPSHLLPGQQQQQQQQHQSQINQTQPPTTNQLGLGDATVTTAGGVGPASHAEVLSSNDLDKKQQQHKSHQQHSHSQQLHQKQQLGTGAVGFGKQQQQPPVSLEPKTYANLVKSGVSSGTPLSFASAMQASLSSHSSSQQSSQSAGQQQQSQQQQQQQQQQAHQQQHQSYNSNSSSNRQQQQQRDILSPTPVGGVNQNTATNGGVSNKYGSDRQDDRGTLGNGGMSQQRSQQQRSIRSNGTSSNSMGGGGLRQQDNRQSSYSRQNYNDSDDRRQGSSSQFGDNHQLFLGNIPHHATEEELKTLFSKFGTVVDLRIMSKSVQKMPGVRTPPHYGFITYEDPASVQNCLANMPLYFPDNSSDGHKLNVEEKKTRVRGPGEGSGRMNSGGGGGLGSGNSNGPRSGGTGSGQSRAPGGQGGVSSNRGSGGGGGGTGQRSLGGNVGGGGNGGNRGNSGSYGQRSDRNNVGNSQRSVGNANGISNRGFGSGY